MWQAFYSYGAHTYNNNNNNLNWRSHSCRLDGAVRSLVSRRGGRGRVAAQQAAVVLLCGETRWQEA